MTSCSRALTNATRNSSSMSAPMPSVPRPDRVRESSGPGVADRVVHVGAGVVDDGARTGRGRRAGGRRGPATSRRRCGPGAAARCRSRPRRRGRGRPHRGAPAISAAAAIVSSVQVKAAWRPTMPRPPAARNRSFSARPAAAPVGPVPVGDAVGAVDPHADLGAGVGDDRQRPLDRVGRLVVIDDRRAAPLERFERAELGRPLDRVGVERAVEPPPHQLEDLHEPGRGARRRRHAPGERGVEMVMGADQTRGLVRAAEVHGATLHAVGPFAVGLVDQGQLGAPLAVTGVHARPPPPRRSGTRPISPTPLMP